MNEQHHTEILPNLLRDDSFDVARRGYEKRQVDDFVARSRNQIRDLQERLARALDDVEQTRRELTAAREAATTKPQHEELSDRLAQILKLADEEAEAKKAVVEGEIEENRKRAEAELEKSLAEAREHAERVVTAAREQAQQMITSAKEESERLRTDSEQRAHRALSEAESRAAAINEHADRRLETLTSTHGEAIRRMTEIQTTLADLLRRDAAAGPLDHTQAPPADAQETAGQPPRPAMPEPEPELVHAEAVAPAPGRLEPVQADDQPAAVADEDETDLRAADDGVDDEVSTAEEYDRDYAVASETDETDGEESDDPSQTKAMRVPSGQKDQPDEEFVEGVRIVRE